MGAIKERVVGVSTTFQVCMRKRSIRTEALEDHVHRNGEIDQLGGLMKRGRYGRDGREVTVGC